MAALMHLRNFQSARALLTFINSGVSGALIPQSDIQEIHGPWTSTHWTLLFWWDATAHLPVVTAGTNVGDGTLEVLSGVSIVNGPVTVRITTLGQNTVAKFKWRIGSGTESAEISTAADVDLTTTLGLHLKFDNGAINPSFSVNDTFTIAAVVGNPPPGSDGINPATAVRP